MTSRQGADEPQLIRRDPEHSLESGTLHILVSQPLCLHFE